MKKTNPPTKRKRLCGAPVYSSNLQLGGPGIMFANGVSHACVRNDLEGVAAMLQWLSYVPERRGAPLPITRLVREDPVDRDVMYINDPSVLSDPRFLLTGVNHEVSVLSLLNSD